jgi:hypothetical protein
MTGRHLLFWLIFLTTGTVNAQSTSEKKLLVGTWSVASVSYGDYYSYYIKEDTLIVNEKLGEIIRQDSARYTKEFFATLKKQAAAYGRQCSFVINGNKTYSLSLGTKKERGDFEFLPLEIPISKESPESDITYNLEHEEDFAYMRLNNDKTVRITEYADALQVYVSNKIEGIGKESFNTTVTFILNKK